MSSEVRKIKLIERILKEKNDAILGKLEAVFNKAECTNGRPSFSAHDLVGAWSKEDAFLIKKAIQES